MRDIGLLDLLQLAGFSATNRTKLVRHQDPRYDAQDLLRRGWLDTYQAFQSRPVFDKTDLVVSFIGMRGNRARFIGIYRVLGRRPSQDGSIPADCPYLEWRNVGYFYDLQRQTGFDHLENRVIIDWQAARAWHQLAKNRPVVEILPAGYLLEPFDDYLQFNLTHFELRYVVKHQEAHKEWRARLSAVAGVYLVLATTTGDQYVGSAYGAQGIWGRWSAYARNGHAGNSLLRALVSKNVAYPDGFSYSVLQILPTSFARSEVLQCERHFKQKLGSRAIGLNAN